MSNLPKYEVKIGETTLIYNFKEAIQKVLICEGDLPIAPTM